MTKPLFRSFFMGGFECSTHRPWHQRRLDMIEATGHGRFPVQDYARMKEYGLLTARDGIRWHLIEKTPGVYDFSSVLPSLQAARAAGVQVIWDLCHYGWPDDLDIFAPEFVDRYARMAGAFARLLSEETDDVPMISPMNEISFFSWAGGMVGYFNPFAHDRGNELKEQLVRATIAGIEAIWAVNPNARFVHADPVVRVVRQPDKPEDQDEANTQTNSQYEAWDMIAGRVAPHLGGNIRYLDIIGMNYYPHNQWLLTHLPFHPSDALNRHSPLYRPFRFMAQDVYERYGRPLFLAETGEEDDMRAEWFEYICDEVRAARLNGVPIEGICLYPIVNFPFWDDEKHLHHALWDYPDEQGEREIYLPLALELRREQQIFARLADAQSLSACRC